MARDAAQEHASEHCRPAADVDLSRIAELADVLVAESADAKGGPIWSSREARPAPHLDSYRALLDRDDASLVVGTIDDVVVGFGAAEIERLRTGADLGVITDLYVEPEARGIGVGEAMIDALLAFCTERGCIGVDALALPGARATKNFFEGHGFTARALLMHHKL